MVSGYETITDAKITDFYKKIITTLKEIESFFSSF